MLATWKVKLSQSFPRILQGLGEGFEYGKVWKYEAFEERLWYMT